MGTRTAGPPPSTTSAICTGPHDMLPSAKNARSPRGCPWASTACCSPCRSGVDNTESKTRTPTDPMSTKTSEIVWQVDVPGWQIVTLAHNSFTFVQTFEVPTETDMT